MFHLVMQPNIIFNIVTFWEVLVNSQLSYFSITGCFRFPSLVIYLFLYVHVEKFMHLGLNIRDPNRRKHSMVNWTDFIRIPFNCEGFSYLIALFMSVIYTIISNSPPHPPVYFIKPSHSYN